MTWFSYLLFALFFLGFLPFILLILLYALLRHLAQRSFQWGFLVGGIRRNFWAEDKVGVLLYGSAYKGLVKQKLYPLWGEDLIFLHFRDPQSLNESGLPPRYARYLQEHLERLVSNRRRWEDLPIVLLLKGRFLDWEMITLEEWMLDLQEKEWKEFKEVKEVTKKIEGYKERFCYW